MDNELLDILNLLNRYGCNPHYEVNSAVRQGDGSWVLSVKKVESPKTDDEKPEAANEDHE